MTDDARMRDAWDVYLYARDLLAKRMSYGMIAQSMLLIAFATLTTGRANGHEYILFFQCVVGLLGIIYTIYQYFRVRVINDKIRYVEEKYLASPDLIFQDYLRFGSRQRFPREFSQLTIIIIFFLAWIVLFLGALLLRPG